MGYLRKFRREIVVALVIVVLYFLPRLLTLTHLPIFTDEAIYIRWAQIAKQDAAQRFISLTDGKQPLFIWLTALALKFFHDPLVAGRMVSVAAGFGTTIGMFFLGREVFRSRWIGLVSSLLYVLFPFSLVYDRMAMYDSLIGAFTVWGLYLTVLLVRRVRLDLAFILGFVCGGAVLNKTNGFFTIYLLPFSLILFDWKKKDRTGRLLRFIGCAVVAVTVTYGLYAILRLSPFYYIINQKNAVFVYPVGEWLHHPFLQLWPNTNGLVDWYFRYVGIPFTLAALASFVVAKAYFREKLLLVAWFILPFVALAFFGRLIYPRYILFMTYSLLPLVAYTLVVLYQKLNRPLWIGLTALIVVYSLFADVMILTNFAKAPIPQADKGQYLTGWPAGVGINETVSYFRDLADKEPIFIGTEGTFGLMPEAYEIYLKNNPNVTIKGYWPITENTIKELEQQAAKQTTYMVFFEDCPSCQATGVGPVDWPLKQVMQFKRIDPHSYLTVYQVLPR